jgi:hypothetical protein
MLESEFLFRCYSDPVTGRQKGRENRLRVVKKAGRIGYGSNFFNSRISRIGVRFAHITLIGRGAVAPKPSPEAPIRQQPRELTSSSFTTSKEKTVSRGLEKLPTATKPPGEGEEGQGYGNHGNGHPQTYQKPTDGLQGRGTQPAAPLTIFSASYRKAQGSITAGGKQEPAVAKGHFPRIWAGFLKP